MTGGRVAAYPYATYMKPDPKIVVRCPECKNKFQRFLSFLDTKQDCQICVKNVQFEKFNGKRKIGSPHFVVPKKFGHARTKGK